MAFDTTPPRFDYVGTGAVATYDFPNLKIAAGTDLRVTKQDTAGVETTLVFGVDFTVTGLNLTTGGTITLTAGNLPLNYKLTIRYDRTPDQTTDYRNQGGVFLETVEESLDRLTRYVQALRDKVQRSMHLPETEAGSELATVTPTLALRASKFAYWDNAGNLTGITFAIPGALIVSAFIETLLDDANAATARTTLGVPTLAEVLAAAVVADNIFRVTGSSDATKKLAFEVDGFTTGTTRTITPPNANLTLPLISAAGDLVYGSAADVLTKLALGTTRKVLEVNAGATAPVWADRIVLGTPVATTSGTTITMTGIPAGVKRITIMGNNISTNGTSVMRIQVGGAGGFGATGYFGGVSSIAGANVWATGTGIDLNTVSVAAGGYTFTLTLTLINSLNDVWSVQGLMARRDSAGTLFMTNGSIDLGSAPTQIQLTTVNGTDTFDLGELNITYE